MAPSKHVKKVPPKKSQPDQKNKSSEKCNFYNRGYCKSKGDCIKTHNDEVCDDLECEEDNCPKRHPYECKYGIRCRFNKKKECEYSHVTLATDDGKIEALKLQFNNKVSKLENSCTSLQKELEEKNLAIVELHEKIDDIKKLVIICQGDIKEKNAEINGLQMKLEEFEKGQQKHKKQSDKRIKDLESAAKQLTSKERVPEHKKPEEEIKCPMCDFQTTSKQGLKIHNSKVHSKINFADFPAACDVCEQVLSNIKELNQHKKREHMFHTVKFQCNECQFMANEPQTLQVHFGMEHSTKKQCGLCDKEFTSKKELETHLTICEIFVCDNSGCRDTFLSDSEVREHIRNIHKKNAPEHYSWFYWIYDSKDKSEIEINKQDQRILPKDW